MGFFSPDMESMIDIYQRETLELTDECEQHILEAMQRQQVSSEDIECFFRITHTIKSSSAMMGMDELSTCTHRLEDLFTIFRKDISRARGNEKHIFDLLYAYSDYIKGEMARITEPDYRPAPIDALRNFIESGFATFTGTPAPAEPAPAAPAAPAEPAAPAGPIVRPGYEGHVAAEETGTPVSKVWRVMLDEKCQMKNVRAFMLIKQLRPFCSVLTSVPADLESENSSAVVDRDGVIITFTTTKSDVIARKLTRSPFVRSIEDMTEPAPEAEPQAAQTGDVPQSPATKPAAHDEAASTKAKYGMLRWQQIMSLQEILGELITSNTLLDTALKHDPAYRRVENILLAEQRLLAELEEIVDAATLMPVSSIVPQYYRIVRDICSAEGKDVNFQVHGDDLEVDRNLLDAITNPIIHLMRNAIDHGIESPDERAAHGKSREGNVTLSVENFGGNLRFVVSDDGAGMDADALLEHARSKNLLTKPAGQYSREEIFGLIFVSGFSTTEQANKYSGRGVGMSVVQNVVDSLGGIVRVESEPGKGTSVFMEVPVSITSQECVRFSVGRHVCLLPIKSIDHIYVLSEVRDRVRSMDGQTWFQDESLLPVVDLYDLFGEPDAEKTRIIVVHGMRDSIALITGIVADRQYAVEKPLPEILGQNYSMRTGISGCSITGDGTLGLMLSPDRFIKIYQKEVQRNGKSGASNR